MCGGGGMRGWGCASDPGMVVGWYRLRGGRVTDNSNMRGGR